MSAIWHWMNMLPAEWGWLHWLLIMGAIGSALQSTVVMVRGRR